MSILTQSERDGLDDVFSSIQSDNNNYKFLKDLSLFIMSKKNDILSTRLLKQAKYGIKQRKKPYFLTFNSKKKKNLSK